MLSLVDASPRDRCFALIRYSLEIFSRFLRCRCCRKSVCGKQEPPLSAADIVIGGVDVHTPRE